MASAAINQCRTCAGTTQPWDRDWNCWAPERSGKGREGITSPCQRLQQNNASALCEKGPANHAAPDNGLQAPLPNPSGRHVQLLVRSPPVTTHTCAALTNT